MQTVSNILIVGGTHGNELTGVRTVEQWSSLVDSVPSIKTNKDNIKFNTLMANPMAVEQRVRFVDADLNRQFSIDALSQKHTSIEARRALELHQQFGTNSLEHPDLVIDIHNTTSNMGMTLILIERNHFNQQLARHINNQVPECHILLEDDQSYADHPYLCSLGKFGVMIEMGAQPQGVCRADVFAQSIQLLNAMTEFVSLWNQQQLPNNRPAPVYQFIENINFPTDDMGKVAAMIHPDLQDNDFIGREPGEPIFIDFAGQVMHWQGKERIYPHFINEAAYQGTNVAFATARKFEW